MRNVTYLPGAEIALIFAAVDLIWKESLASYEQRRARNEPFDGHKNLQRFKQTLVALRAIYGMDLDGPERQSRKGARPQILSDTRGLKSMRRSCQVQGGRMVLATGQCPKGLFGFNDPQNHTAITTSKVFGINQTGCTEDEPGVVGNDYYSICGTELKKGGEKALLRRQSQAGVDSASDASSCVSEDGDSDGPSEEGSSVGSDVPVANRGYRVPRKHNAEKLREAGHKALAALLLQSGLIDHIFVVLLVGKIAATKLAAGAWPSWSRRDGPNPGWGERVVLKPEGLPAILPRLADIPAISLPHPAAILYSRSNAPALAYGVIASSPLVTEIFDMERVSLKTRLTDLLNITEKLRYRAVRGMKKLIAAITGERLPSKPPVAVEEKEFKMDDVQVSAEALRDDLLTRRAAVRANDYLHRLWAAIRSWLVDTASRKLYWCRAGPPCLHLSVFIPGEETKVCRSKHPPLQSEDYRSPEANSPANVRICNHMWGLWQECSDAEYRLFERAAETNDDAALLDFIFQQWEEYEEGVRNGSQSHDRLVEYSLSMKTLADTLAEGKEEVQQVQNGTLDAAKCIIRACLHGHWSKSRQAGTRPCQIIVSGKAQCNQETHFMGDDDCKAFKKMVDRCLPTEAQPLQGPPLLEHIRNRVEKMAAAKKDGLVGQDAFTLKHRLKGYQKCAEDVHEDRTPLVCGAGIHLHPATTGQGKVCNKEMETGSCRAVVRKDQLADQCCLDLLKDLRERLQSKDLTAVQLVEKHLQDTSHQPRVVKGAKNLIEWTPLERKYVREQVEADPPLTYPQILKKGQKAGIIHKKRTEGALSKEIQKQRESKKFPVLEEALVRREAARGYSLAEKAFAQAKPASWSQKKHLAVAHSGKYGEGMFPKLTNPQSHVTLSHLAERVQEDPVIQANPVFRALRNQFRKDLEAQAAQEVQQGPAAGAARRPPPASKAFRYSTKEKEYMSEWIRDKKGDFQVDDLEKAQEDGVFQGRAAKNVAKKIRYMRHKQEPQALQPANANEGVLPPRPAGVKPERPAQLAEEAMGPAAPLPGPMPGAAGLLSEAGPWPSRPTGGQLPGLTQRRKRGSRDEADLDSHGDRPPRQAMTTLQGLARRRRQVPWEEAGTVIIPDTDDEPDDEIHLPRNPRRQRLRLDEADPEFIPDDNNDDDAPISLDSD